MSNVSFIDVVKSGNPVVITDGAKQTHKVKVEVKSKNLFDISKFHTNTTYGIYSNGDGTLTCVSRASSGGSTHTIAYFAPELKVGETYTLSADTTCEANYIWLGKANCDWVFGTSKTITQDILDSEIFWYNGNSSGMPPATISNIQIELGTVATAYVPYGYLADSEVTLTGKNLFDILNYGEHGVTIDRGFCNNGDGSLTISGFYTTNYNYKLRDVCPSLKVGETYVLNADTDGTMKAVYLSGSNIDWIFGRALTITNEILDSYIIWYNNTNNNPDDTTPVIYFNLQIERGAVATAYEEYKEPQIQTTDSSGVCYFNSLYPTMIFTSDGDLTVTYRKSVEGESEDNEDNKELSKDAEIYKYRMSNYYPQVIQNILEFKAIIDGEYPEIDRLHTAANNVVSDAYLQTMSEDRIYQWEQVLGIKPISDSTIEDRRETIIARIRGQGKLNSAMINRIVSTFTGGTANSYLKNGTLCVEITPPPNNKSYKFVNVEQELKNKVPAHLGLNVTRNYNRWSAIQDNHANWQSVNEQFGSWKEVLYSIQ